MCVINAQYIKGDPYNKMRIRNARNTDPEEFNCGGYAFDIFSWYVPCENKDNPFYFSYQFNTKAEEETILLHCIEVMLNEIEGLRVIKDLSEVKSDEYAIAFKIAGTYDDFHFIRRGKNGVWYEKMGSCYGIDRVPKKKVFAKEWGRYHGRTVFFAKKDS